MKKYMLATMAVVALNSCKTVPTAEKPISTAAPVASASGFFSTINKKSQFDQIKINSRITAETGTFIPTLDAVIYIEKDQKVWINMIAIFLNVGRGIATPAGIKGYEKWNKTYIESDFTYLNNLLNVDFIDYQAFQNLLLGKTFIPVQEKDYDLTRNAQGYALKSRKNIAFKTGKTISEYMISMQYNPDFTLTQVSLQKADAPDLLEVSYGERENVADLKVPKTVKIVIKGSKDSQILLENTKFENSRMDTPYSVPANYKKTEIK